MTNLSHKLVLARKVEVAGRFVKAIVVIELGQGN